MPTPQATADIGLIGLAVMGENLVLNMESHGFTVAVFNRTTSKVDAFLAGRAKGKKIVGAHTPQELVASLKRPRKIMIMVKAGAAGRRGDRRAGAPARQGRHPDRRRQFPLPGLDAAHPVSEGEGHPLHRHRRLAAARRGRSRVRRSCRAAIPRPGRTSSRSSRRSRPRSPTARPCCDWVGPEGAGHFVKMVHNGIEYGDMQLICEAYDVMRRLLGLDARRHARRLRAVEHRPAGQLPDRDHARHPRLHRPRVGQADDRPDPRHRRPEGDRQVDRRSRPATSASR